jgi:hypothetical protein
MSACTSKTEFRYWTKQAVTYTITEKSNDLLSMKWFQSKKNGRRTWSYRGTEVYENCRRAETVVLGASSVTLQKNKSHSYNLSTKQNDWKMRESGRYPQHKRRKPVACGRWVTTATETSHAESHETIKVGMWLRHRCIWYTEWSIVGSLIERFWEKPVPSYFNES